MDAIDHEIISVASSTKYLLVATDEKKLLIYDIKNYTLKATIPLVEKPQ